MLGFADARALRARVSEARTGVASLFRSILPDVPRPPSRHAVLLVRLSEPDEALAEEVEDVFGDPEVVDHLHALARRPDGLLGTLTQEQYPELPDDILEALAGSSDPEQAARYLRALFARFASP